MAACESRTCRGVVAAREIGRLGRVIVGAAMVLASSNLGSTIAKAAQVTPAPANRQIGTVKTVTANKLTITTDSGVLFSVNVVDDAKVLQLPPGSTDLKAAKTIALGDIEVGDRVLVNGHADAADALTASRVILMKSTEIAQKNESQETDWQKRGTGGLVKAVDPGTGTLIITLRGHQVAVKTTGQTVFRRYAGDSVKFQDAVRGSFAQIQPGDQIRVRGDKSEDGAAIQAEEVVSGAFRNLAGTVIAIDVPGNKVTLKDVATKKTYAIQLTANSILHVLPPDVAARFAARAKGEATAAGAGAGGGGTASGGASGSAASPGSVSSGAGGARPTGGYARGGSRAESGGSSGGDLSQMLSRLPQASLKDLHTGDALMVVATQPQAGSVALTAIELLSGVEPILAATPSGMPSMTLSPWEVGGPDGGGGA